MSHFFSRSFIILLSLCLLGVLARLFLPPLGDDADIAHLIFYHIRLPRVLLCLLAGSAFALTGAAMQALFHNPLASPDLLGSASGAILAAIIVWYFFPADLRLLLPLFGLIGALTATYAAYLLGGSQAAPLRLLLAGLAINTFLGVCITFALNLAPNPFALNEIMHWLYGDLERASLHDVFLCLPPCLLGAALIFLRRHDLAALSLGRATAQSLGSSAQPLLVMLAIALLIGAVTPITGNIAFLGLLVPHMLRPLAGHHPVRLLPLSAVGGALLVLVADALTTLPAWHNLRLGMLTALLGTPFFIVLLWRERRRDVQRGLHISAPLVRRTIPPTAHAEILTHNLCVHYGNKMILNNINLEIRQSGLYLLLGANGSGKSTLLRTLAGLQEYTGSLYLNGHDLRHLSTRQRSLHLAYLAQNSACTWSLSVEDMVSLARVPHGFSDYHSLDATNRAAVERSLELCHLQNLRHSPIDHLSGGEQARAHLARLLAGDTPLLFLDEAGAALDRRHQHELLNILQTFQNKIILLSSHQLSSAEHADGIILLHQGSILAQGSLANVQPYFSKAYAGE